MMQQKLRITATQREISLCKGNTHCCLVTLTLCLLSLNVNGVRLSSLSPFLLSVCLIPPTPPHPTPKLPPPLCVVSLSCHTLLPPQFLPGACLLLLLSCGCVPAFVSFSVTLFLLTSLFMLLLPSPRCLPIFLSSTMSVSHMCAISFPSSAFFLFLFC